MCGKNSVISIDAVAVRSILSFYSDHNNISYVIISIYNFKILRENLC